MDEHYDVIICGTGLKECILGGLLAVSGKKVLQLDRNGYYGGSTASLNLTNFFKKYAPDTEPPQNYGANRDWNIDLIPKFVMSNGNLVKMLLHTKVTRYLEWQVVEGTYVYQYQKAGFFSNEKHIHKVPATDIEALKSPLLSMMEKNRCKNFFKYCATWDSKDSTQKYDPLKTTMQEVYADFGLQPSTIDFIGHAVALYSNDDYLTEPMGVTMEKIQLYMHSLIRYGQSPFIYPIYGLGTLPEGFSRLCAIHGGTFMLNKPVKKFLYDNGGQVSGVETEDGDVFKCSSVVCDPSYAMHKVKATGQVIRCICILGKLPQEMGDVTSAQLIIPQSQTGRKSDIYMALVSSRHGVAKDGKYLAWISTTVETQTPETEINAALKLLDAIEYKFIDICNLYEPNDTGLHDKVFVSSSYDASSHFESSTEDVMQMWEHLTGTKLTLSTTANLNNLENA